MLPREEASKPGFGDAICPGKPEPKRRVNGTSMVKVVAELCLSSGIPFSAMRSGEWRILLAGEEVQVQRSITLTVGEPEVETVTVCITARSSCYGSPVSLSPH